MLYSKGANGINPMFNFDPEFDEPAYAYLWQDDEDADELEDDDHPSLTVAERNPSLAKQ